MTDYINAARDASRDLRELARHLSNIKFPPASEICLDGAIAIDKLIAKLEHQP